MRTSRSLFISSNGTGMGHLTRLIAYARRVEPDLTPYFFSLSQAVPIVGSFDYPYEYLASRETSGLAARHWHRYLCQCLVDTLDRINPAVVVFDGAWPYDGLRMARQERPDVPWVWSRRGMWRPGVNTDQVAKAAWFDAVVEPGDFAASEDQGATRNESAYRIAPVTLLDDHELADRTTARTHLGLAEGEQHALLTLGAGVINNLADTVTEIARILHRLDVHVCVTDVEIADSMGIPDGVHVVREYPLSRFLRAFDIAVSASGYNSFHELLRFGVPTLFIPNRSTRLDDQAARARWASDHGLAHCLLEATGVAATPLLEDLLANGVNEGTKMVDLDPGNGAAEGADYLRRIALDWP